MLADRNMDEPKIQNSLNSHCPSHYKLTAHKITLRKCSQKEMTKSLIFSFDFFILNASFNNDVAKFETLPRAVVGFPGTGQTEFRNQSKQKYLN